jgi:pimeloyl-ACP methyl ester carboxylesterase
MHETKDHWVKAGKETLACSLDYLDASKRPTVIALHGAGPSNRSHTRYLSETFIQNGENVVRFDFSGQGESSGTMQESSLAKRQGEAIAIIEHFQIDTDNLTVIGTSMGGYIAASLAKIYPVKNLILFCPAAYDVTAWEIPFNADFTAILRRDLSLLKSNVQELLATFAGNSLLLWAENDEIIPPLIVDMYESALSGKPKHATCVIQGSPHPIHRWVADKEEQKAKILEEIRKFITGPWVR